MSGSFPANAVNATGPATNPSYVARQIDVSITLGEGSFGQTAGNQVKLSGLRVVASIAKRGMPSMDAASLRIYGLHPSLMNQLSTVGVLPTMDRQNNTVTIEAGDAIAGMTTVFTGDLYRAYQVLDEADTFFELECWTGMAAAMQPVQPTTYAVPFDVAGAMATLANRLNLSFENNGVQVTLQPSYLIGTYYDQVRALVRAAHIEAIIDSAATPPVLAIWPRNSTRGGARPLIQAASGLVGYPRFEQFGISFRTIFNPSIRFGGTVQMNTSLFPPATAGATSSPAEIRAAGPNGVWYIASLTLSLSSQEPNGPWFCDCAGARVADTPLPQGLPAA